MLFRSAAANRAPSLSGKPSALAKKNPVVAAGKAIDSKTLASKPTLLNPGIVLGGISTSNVGSTPLATVLKTKTEVQLAQDVPTRISVAKLQKNTTAIIRLFTSDGKTISIGTLVTDRSGNITLPPLTFLDSGVVTTLQVVAGSSTINITVRSTK